MTANVEQPQKNIKQALKTEKKINCFVIMPIADMAGYEPRHFTRVYNHIIKPACEKSGFAPIRADEVTNSNFIVLDILRRIVECDLAICDLSGRNPNVMYELGLRQAFNKKTVLIKDDKTISPFDVQAFRYCEYDSSLRIDNAFANIDLLAKALKSTYESDSFDVNSIVQLLKIQPAQVGEKTILSTQDTFILEAIKDLSNQVSTLSNKQGLNNGPKRNSLAGHNFKDLCKLYPLKELQGKYYRFSDGEKLGKFIGLGVAQNGSGPAYVFEYDNEGSSETSYVPIDYEFLDEILPTRAYKAD